MKKLFARHERDRGKLKELLQASVGCQCQMVRPTGLAFQGEIESFRMPEDDPETIIIPLVWECFYGHFLRDNHSEPELKWYPVCSPHPGYHCLTMKYDQYYFQKDEGRIKIICQDDTILRIFNKAGDYANLVEKSGRWTPYYGLEPQDFIRLVINLCRNE